MCVKKEKQIRKHKSFYQLWLLLTETEGIYKL